MPDVQNSTGRFDAPDSSGRWGPETSGKPAVPPAQKRRGMGRRPQPSHRWVDEGYYDENPWFDQERQKPVFSLGAPFPRMTRRSKRNKQQSTHPSKASRPKEDLAELGEVTPEESPPAGAEGAERAEPRRTAEGVSHGDKFNDAGQPVFDYTPEKAEQQDTQDTRGMQHTERSRKEDEPNFGLDSEPIGRREREEVEEGNEDPNKYRNWWARVRAKHPEPLAEFLATFIAVFIGLASTLSVSLSAGQEQQYGSYETTCWAFGFAWMFGIYLGGGVSGAHMNPAISIVLSLFRGFPWASCGIYIFAQFLASMSASALAYGCFRDTIRHVDPTKTDTAKTLFSSPPEFVSLGTACLNEVVGSAIMVIAILALGDDQNNPPGAGMHAFILGLLVTTTRFTLGYNVGSALNPATDFAPRIVSWAVGYRGPEVFNTGWWLYGPWLSTLAGSILGAIIYDGLIFVGSESPVNYRIPDKFRERAQKMVKLGT